MPSQTIAAVCGISKKTVQRWIRWQKEGSVKTNPRSGRPRVTTHEKDARLLAAIEEAPKNTVVQLTRDLSLPCHPVTCRRRLHKSSIHCYIPAKKQKLTQAHKEALLGFALGYLPVDLSFLRNVIFADEKSYSSVSKGARHCWRRVSTRYMERTLKKKPPVVVLVSICGDGCGLTVPGSLWCWKVNLPVCSTLKCWKKF